MSSPIVKAFLRIYIFIAFGIIALRILKKKNKFDSEEFFRLFQPLFLLILKFFETSSF